MTKQFSPACERNREPIFAQIAPLLRDAKNVLEIGSGTGQHAAYFAPQLPHLSWHCSDRIANHASINAWRIEAQSDNLLCPIELDIGKTNWPKNKFDAVFTANTCHIMRWVEVQILFRETAPCLAEKGQFIIYGPFNYGGKFTSESNAIFDASLKSQAPHMGIRDIEKMTALGTEHELQLQLDIPMPANNRLLVFVPSPD